MLLADKSGSEIGQHPLVPWWQKTIPCGEPTGPPTNNKRWLKGPTPTPDPGPGRLLKARSMHAELISTLFHLHTPAFNLPSIQDQFTHLPSFKL